MKKLSYEQYLALRKEAEILASDSFGEKVLRLKDGSIVKLFRLKRIISSALFYPYDLRFVNNVAKLKKIGIETVTVIDSYKIPSIKRMAVHYMELEGDTLRYHIIHQTLISDVARRLAVFIAKLHNEGVYFRSIHFGNILILPENNFGLIDIADIKIKHNSLNFEKRIRNFRHLIRYEIDKNYLKSEIHTFVEAYCNESNITQHEKNKFKGKINQLIVGEKLWPNL